MELQKQLWSVVSKRNSRHFMKIVILFEAKSRSPRFFFNEKQFRDNLSVYLTITSELVSINFMSLKDL